MPPRGRGKASMWPWGPACPVALSEAGTVTRLPGFLKTGKHQSGLAALGFPRPQKGFPRKRPNLAPNNPCDCMVREQCRSALLTKSWTSCFQKVPERSPLAFTSLRGNPLGEGSSLGLMYSALLWQTLRPSRKPLKMVVVGKQLKHFC